MSTDNDTAMHLADDLAALRRHALALLTTSDLSALDAGERGTIFGTLALAIERVEHALDDATRDSGQCPHCHSARCWFVGNHLAVSAAVRGCYDCGHLHLVGGAR